MSGKRVKNQTRNVKCCHQGIAIQGRKYFGKLCLQAIRGQNPKTNVEHLGTKIRQATTNTRTHNPHGSWTWSGIWLCFAKPLPADSRNPSSQTRPRLVQGITQNQWLSHPHPFEVLSCKACPGWLGESLQVRGYTHAHTTHANVGSSDMILCGSVVGCHLDVGFKCLTPPPAATQAWGQLGGNLATQAGCHTGKGEILAHSQD